MKKFKKVMSLTLVAAMTMALLAGCGGSAETAAEGETS